MRVGVVLMALLDQLSEKPMITKTTGCKHSMSKVLLLKVGARLLKMLNQVAVIAFGNQVLPCI